MKYLLFTAFLFCSLASNAQVTKDSLIKKMSAEICDEVSKQDFSNLKGEDLNMQLGLLFLPVLTKYQEEMKTAFGVTDMTDESQMENVGKEIGQYMAFNCPAFVKMIAQISKNDKEEPAKKTAVADEIKVADQQVQGKFVALTPGAFSFFTIKLSNGKTEKIWWMEYFQGASQLTESSAKLANRQVTVKYTEREVYQAAQKQYVKIKIATGLELE